MAYCKHLDENGEPCGNAAKEEYGNRFCGIHKASFYMAEIADHLAVRKLLEERLARINAEHDIELERMKSYTSKESKISTALLWVGSLCAAAFAGAMATYLIMN